MSTQVIDQPKAQSAIMVLRDRLLQRRGELDAALEGSGISSDRFIRTAVSAATMQPELVSDVSFQSLWQALLQACRDRLLPDGKEGVILPFKGRAKWIPMTRGLLSLFERSGEYKWITANVHRDDDREFDFWLDEHGQHFMHRPGPGKGNVQSTYACATTRSGAFFVTVITEDEMTRIRNVSRARGADSPWTSWPDEMRKKSALRRLCKLLPVPQPLEDMIHSDDDDGEPGETATPAGKPLSRPRGAASALEQFADEPEREPADAAQSGEPEGGTDNGTK